MKTRITSMLTLASMVLFLTSCQKDSFVDTVSPDYTMENSADLRSPADFVRFELWQDVEILQLDCDDPILVSNSEDKRDEITRTSGCYAFYGLTSDIGQGFMGGYGRFLSSIELKFDTDKDQVKGWIMLEFQHEHDLLVLKVYGPVIRIVSDDGGVSLQVSVLYQKGTERFQYVQFSGTLTIMDADKIFDGEATDYSATLVIKGAFGK